MLKSNNKFLEASVTSAEHVRAYRNGRNPNEKWLADALWVVSCKLGYQERHFDVKEGEDFEVFKKIGEKGRTFWVL